MGKETMSKKSDKNNRIRSYPNPTFSSSILNHIDSQTGPTHLRRSRLVQKWMDKPTRRKLAAPVEVEDDPDSLFSTSSTSVSSSDSSFGGFSEAETPSFKGSTKPRSSCFGPSRAPKPVKTAIKAKSDGISEDDQYCSSDKSSWASLKNLKQPISPGLKLAKYMINSLFAKEPSSSANKNKKIKNVDTPPNRKLRDFSVPDRKYKSEQTSPESSFSGFSIANRYSAATNNSSSPTLPKRKVKFCLDDDHMKPVSEEEMRRERLTRRYDKVLDGVAVDLLETYFVRNKDDSGGIREAVYVDESSCSSSDLFEIDHLSLIGNDELPVYQTTNLC